VVTEEHASPELVARYRRGAEIDGEQEWALEAHLEVCGACRARLGEDALVETVWQRLEPELAAQPRPVRRRSLRAWSLPGMLSWAVSAAVVAAGAVLLDRVVPGNPLLVMEPLLPVAGVFAASGRGFDAAHEVVSATARAGLDLLLRRTLVVVSAIVPVLLLAVPVVGIGAAVALLPALGLAAGSLALGSFFGVRRIATLLAVAWVLVVGGQQWFFGEVPWLARPASAGGWVVLVIAAGGIVVHRRETFGRTPLVKF